jgi:hypothetical protein
MLLGTYKAAIQMATEHCNMDLPCTGHHGEIQMHNQKGLRNGTLWQPTVKEMSRE